MIIQNFQQIVRSTQIIKGAYNKDLNPTEIVKCVKANVKETDICVKIQKTVICMAET